VEAVAEVVHTVEIDQVQMKEVTDRDQVQVMIVRELVEVEIVHEQEVVMIDAMVVLQEKESFRIDKWKLEILQ